jgi:transposase
MRSEILRGAERRRRWTVEQKLRMVREAIEPGACLADVARRHDVSRQQLYHWRAAARDGRLSDTGTGVVGFLRVDVGAPASVPLPAAEGPTLGQPVEIGLVGGRSLKVLSSLTTLELRRLIRAVEGA